MSSSFIGDIAGVLRIQPIRFSEVVGRLFRSETPLFGIFALGRGLFHIVEIL